MPTAFFEADTPEPCPIVFGGDTADLVYFLSFAFSARYGAQHELTSLALRLRGGDDKIDLTPLLTFADRNPEDPADTRELERVWQDAAPLAECCRRVVEALDRGDAGVLRTLERYPDLRDRIDDLRRMAEWAAARGARVRITFEL
ncbi:MAG TPA: hypothetical protein VNN12_07205 [Dehalococcoidia bacterium]|jgi:hypothetical protein|nr:hypothetical protein [Dehalococcoidia bacterium]